MSPKTEKLFQKKYTQKQKFATTPENCAAKQKPLIMCDLTLYQFLPSSTILCFEIVSASNREIAKKNKRLAVPLCMYNFIRPVWPRSSVRLFTNSAEYGARNLTLLPARAALRYWDRARTNNGPSPTCSYSQSSLLRWFCYVCINESAWTRKGGRGIRQRTTVNIEPLAILEPFLCSVVEDL